MLFQFYWLGSTARISFKQLVFGLEQGWEENKPDDETPLSVGFCFSNTWKYQKIMSGADFHLLFSPECLIFCKYSRSALDHFIFLDFDHFFYCDCAVFLWTFRISGINFVVCPKVEAFTPAILHVNQLMVKANVR